MKFLIAIATLLILAPAGHAQTAGVGKAGGTGNSLFASNGQTATYQALPSDFQFCKTIPVASGTFTLTLVASTTQPPSGQCIFVENYGSGVLTIARSGQNINGAAANFTVPAGSASTPNAIKVISDGTNYFAQPFFGASSTTVSGQACSLGGTCVIPRGIPFSLGDQNASAALTVAGVGSTDFITVPFACTIAAYNLIVDATDTTFRVKFWKVATGTAIPTSANSISTSGVGVPSGTAIHSTTLTDFTTTAVAANDIIGFALSTGNTVKYVSGVLQCNQ